ncbi:protein PonA [Neisseria gonorrhoeae]|uniref:Protein PonA n=1 Tax=Neisseria gonorrhoeae TaxID=485 RepID=A0A378W1V6_NEIGO|nr:protein PonA [Neisseria gonorrhoeae]
MSKSEDVEETVSQYLSGLYTVDKMVPAVVLDVTKRKMSSYSCPAAGGLRLTGAPWVLRPERSIMRKWGGPYPQGRGHPCQNNGGRWAVVQEPLLQGALVSLDAKTGAARALVGGYDFHSKHSIVPFRQCGSRVRPLSRLSIRRHYLRG